MSRRLLVLLLAGVALLCAVGVCSLQPEAIEPAAVAAITGTSELEVGSSTTVEIQVDDLSAQTVPVVIAAGRTHDAIDVAVAGGRGSLPLGPPLTNVVGVISVMDQDGTVSHEVRVLPNRLVAGVELFVSGRVLTADQTATAHALVTDRFGNSVADGIAVEFTVRRDDTVETVEAVTVNGRATAPLSIDARPGESLVIAAASDISSLAETVTRLSGTPTAINLEVATPGTLIADGISRVEFTSEPIVDAFGTTLPTGTAVTLVTASGQELGVITGQLSNGQITATMLAPVQPGTITITPRIGEIAGEPITLTFDPAVQPFNYRSTTVDGTTRIDVGPVQAWHGGLVTDGVPVDIGDQQVALVDGRASVVVTGGAPQPVSVLGVQGVSS